MTMETGLLRLLQLRRRTLPRRMSRPPLLSLPSTSRLHMVLPLRPGLRSPLTTHRQPGPSQLSRLTTLLGRSQQNHLNTQLLRLLAGSNPQNHRSTNLLRRPGLSQLNQLTIRPRQPPVRLLPRAGSNQRNPLSIPRLHLHGRNLTSQVRSPQNTLHLPGNSLTNQASTRLKLLLPSTLTLLSLQAHANRSRLRATMNPRSLPWSHQNQPFRHRSRTQASTLQFQCTPPPRLRMRLLL